MLESVKYDERRMREEGQIVMVSTKVWDSAEY